MPDVLPIATPLLGRGDDRSAIIVGEGELAPGLEGTRAEYSYTFAGDDASEVYGWHVVLTAVPETIGFAPRVTCHARGLKFKAIDDRVLGVLDYAIGDVPDTSQMPERRVKLESEAFGERYRLRVDHDLGENWARQLFSPAFIDWLTNDAPEKTSWELFDGMLCVFTPVDPSSTEVQAAADAPDALIAAAAKIAKRLREEALEEAGMDSAGKAAQTDRPEQSLDAQTARWVATEKWKEPPPDVATAMRQYRDIGMRTWRPWFYGFAAFLLSLAIGIVLGGIGFISDGSSDSGGAFLAGVALVLGSPVIGYFGWKKFVDDRAIRIGRAAFTGEYAKSRGLQAQQPRLLQARNMQLRFPGVAEAALSGKLPGTDLDATLVMSAAGMASNRAEYNVLISEEPRPLEIPANADLGDGLSAAAHEKTVAIWAQSSGGKERTIKELDEFCPRAERALVDLRSGRVAEPAPAQSS